MKTRMWADAQRDGRPVEYRWRPLLNVVHRVWLTSVERRRCTILPHNGVALVQI